MSTAWLAAQLMTMADRRAIPDEHPRYNPRPPGVLREGSATHAVLLYLRSRPRLYFTHAQILRGTDRSTKAVSWALIFLRAQGLVECVPDASRNARYLRYRIKESA